MKHLFVLSLRILLYVCFLSLSLSIRSSESNHALSWEGDLSSFTFTGDVIQLNAPAVKGEALLFIHYTLRESEEWRVTLQSGYKGTSYNLQSVYLMSLLPSATEPGLAVFVTLGGKNGNITLNRQSGKTKKVLIEGRELVKDNGAEVQVKVTYTKGAFTLYSKLSSEEEFTNEGEVDVDLVPQPGYFMLFAKYSAKFSTNKSFAHLFLQSLSEGSTDEPDEPVKPENPSGPKDPEQPAKPDSTGQIESPAAGELLINEIMANTTGLSALPATEYVELHNVTKKKLDLKECILIYKGKEYPMELPQLEAGGFAVLYKKGKEIAIDKGGSDGAMSLFPTLVNTGTSLSIHDGDGNVLDEITYPKTTPAIAWERDSDGKLQLSTDKRGGTPGSKNSVAASDPEEPETPDEPTDPEEPVDPPTDPEDPSEPDEPGEEETEAAEENDVIFNELLPNPFEGGSEYIELYNRSDKTLSFASLAIATRRSDGTLNTKYPLSSIKSAFAPGKYALLTKDVSGVEDFYEVENSETLHAVKLPILSNTFATLVLFRTDDETVIDEVAYSHKWHASGITNEKGVALERIDPEKETQSAKNWTSASSDTGYGTPGYQNSQHHSSGKEEETSVEEPIYSGITGSYSVKYRFDGSGYNCRAWVFDTSGRLIVKVLDNLSIASEGTIEWNGKAQDGTKLTSGIYIFYLEFYNQEGKVHRYRKVLLVH